MKFAKHLARAMEVSDPEWHPFWVNYKHLKKLLKPAVGNTASLARAAAPAAADGPGSPHAGAAAGAAGIATAARREKGARPAAIALPLPGNQRRMASTDEAAASPAAPGLRRPRPWEAAPTTAAAAATATAVAAAEDEGRSLSPATVLDGSDRAKLARFVGAAGLVAAGRAEAASPAAHQGPGVEPAENFSAQPARAITAVEGKGGEKAVSERTRACGLSGGCCDDVPAPATVVVGCCRTGPSRAAVDDTAAGCGNAGFFVSSCAAAAAAVAAANAAAPAAGSRSGASGGAQAAGSDTAQRHGVAGAEEERL
ncbi:unnamed protein product, partial [Scytosiphon promiscuus]